MAAGGPIKLKRSDFSAKEIQIFDQVYDRLNSGAWTKEKAISFFKNDSSLLQRYSAFSDMRKDEAMAKIVDNFGQTALILSRSVTTRPKTIDDARAKASNVIARESHSISISPPKP